MDDTINTLLRHSTWISSLLLRFGAYVFLRWIPGHPIPPLIVTLLLVYIPSFFYNLAHTPTYRVVADEIDIIATDNSRHAEIVNDIAILDGTDTNDAGEEIVVEETVVVEEREPEVLKTLLTGLPSPSSLVSSLITFAINVGLALMVLDYVYRAKVFYPAGDLSFARLGYVSDTTASILVREPEARHYPLFASYRVSEESLPESAWKAGGSNIHWLDNSTDSTGQFFIKHLKPDTRYQYVVSNNHTGSFITASGKGKFSTRRGRRGTFTFLHSSCLKNNFPYSPFAHPLSNAGLRYLAKVLDTIEAQFMIFLGDFIYIDVPRRHGLSNVEDYRREYRQVYASPDWPAASQNLPWVHVWDDHELANDWSRNTTGYFSAAVNPYENYHTSVNPPLARIGQTYFQFTDGPATFFMLDTRRYRSPNDNSNGSDPLTGAPTKSMLGQQQLHDLLAWLKEPEPHGVRWKILISSVPFTKNWQREAQDTWRGYLGERQIILEAMWDVGARGGVGVVILSGDRHEFAATAFPPPPAGKEVATVLAPIGKMVQGAAGLLVPDSVAGKAMQTKHKHWPSSAVVHEYSASPLNMFYLPVRTYKESSTDSAFVSDVCIKYIPEGNSKFGAVTISTTGDQSVLLYRLYVDGEERWSHTITTPLLTSNEFRNSAIWS